MERAKESCRETGGIIIDGTPATHQQEVAHIGEKEKSNPETAANDKSETEGSPTCSTPGERNKNGQRSSGKRKFETTKETPREQRFRQRLGRDKHMASRRGVEMEDIEEISTPSGATALTLESFTSYMNKDMKTMRQEIKADIAVSIGEVSSRVTRNAEAINEIRAEIKTIRDLPASSASSQTSSSSSSIAHTGLRNHNNEAKYLWARRCLRVWPVRGSDSSALWESAGNFIHDILKVPVDDIGESDIESVRKIRDVRKTISDEALIAFHSPQLRDLVARHAVNLAEARDADGRPTAGLRICLLYTSPSPRD